MKQIPLTRGKFALIDDEDFERVSKFKWHVVLDRSGAFYAVSSIRYKIGYNGQGKIRMHRLLLGLERFDKRKVDHIDLDTLNNIKSNLRIATTSQNAANTFLMKDNASGFKGVLWHKRDKKYQSQIVVNRNSIFLGYFDDPIEAAKAYDREAIKHFGEFARTNKMMGLYVEN